MVPTTKNLTRIVANPHARVPASLREVHDHEPKPRLQSALRRLETVLGAPLEDMPADFGWFEARFPSGGFDGAETFWSSFRAYRHWRGTVGRAIRRHVDAGGTAQVQSRPLQTRHLSATSAQYNPRISAAQLLRHTDVERVRAYYADFCEAESDPKSD